MGKQNKKKEEKEILAIIRRIYKKIKPGLEEGKCLLKDGLLNLSKEDLRIISEKKNAEAIVMLMIMIQAYPGDTCEFVDEDEKLDCVNCFIGLASFAVLHKMEIIEARYGKNKLDPSIAVGYKILNQGLVNLVLNTQGLL